MATCNNTTLIADSECIGESLFKINTNFSNLDSGLCQLGKDVVTLESLVRNLNANDTSTINLTFNGTAYSLIADVINDSLGTAKLGGDIPTTTKQFLTAAKLTSLIDTNIISPIAGHVLTWNGTKWINQPFTEQILLNDLSDVTITSPQNKQYLSYNASTNQWINGTLDEFNVATLSGDRVDITVSGDASTWTINQGVVGEIKLASGAVTNPKLGPAPGLSVKGVSTNVLFATPTDIQATSNNQVLVRVNNALQFGTVPNEATTATHIPTPSTIVSRDGNGDFSANVITARFRGDLEGNATTADTAGYANEAGFARTAGFAISGTAIVSVLSATQAGYATRAGYADTAGYANTAGSVNSAALANRALLADVAVKLQTPRTIALAGAVAGSASFDGSANITINTTSPGIDSRLPKAWVRFSKSGETYTYHKNYNISDISRVGGSDNIFRVTFTSGVQDIANLLVFGNGGFTTEEGGYRPIYVVARNRSSTYIELQFWAAAGGAGFAAGSTSLNDINLIFY